MNLTFTLTQSNPCPNPTPAADGKQNPKSVLRRLLQLDGSAFVNPPPAPVDDPVGCDIADIPRVLKKVQNDWDEPADSFNRLTAYTFTGLLKRRMRLHDESNHDGSVDLLITGCEVSLWLGEQFHSVSGGRPRAILARATRACLAWGSWGDAAVCHF